MEVLLKIIGMTASLITFVFGIYAFLFDVQHVDHQNWGIFFLALAIWTKPNIEFKKG